MAEVKISADSGGGSVALKGPASTTGNAAVSLKLPVADGSAGQYLKTDGSGQLSFNPGKPNILEQFYHICDGSTIATSGGNITLGNVTAVQNATTSFVDVTGSSISYVPPTGTTMVIYEFNFMDCWEDSYGIGCFTFNIDSDEITNQRFNLGGNANIAQLCQYKIGIPIGGTASTTTGRVASWSSAKTLKLQVASHHASNDNSVHKSSQWTGGSNDDQFHQPSIGITAIG